MTDDQPSIDSDWIDIDAPAEGQIVQVRSKIIMASISFRSRSSSVTANGGTCAQTKNSIVLLPRGGL